MVTAISLAVLPSCSQSKMFAFLGGACRCPRRAERGHPEPLLESDDGTEAEVESQSPRETAADPAPVKPEERVAEEKNSASASDSPSPDQAKRAELERVMNVFGNAELLEGLMLPEPSLRLLLQLQSARPLPLATLEHLHNAHGCAILMLWGRHGQEAADILKKSGALPKQSDRELFESIFGDPNQVDENRDVMVKLGERKVLVHLSEALVAASSRCVPSGDDDGEAVGAAGPLDDLVRQCATADPRPS